MRATQRSLLVLLFVFICNMALVAPTYRLAQFLTQSGSNASVHCG